MEKLSSEFPIGMGFFGSFPGILGSFLKAYRGLFTGPIVIGRILGSYWLDLLVSVSYELISRSRF